MNEIEKVNDAPLAKSSSDLDIGAIINAAITSGRSTDDLITLVALAKEMQANHRESLFNKAFTKFKRDCPPIVRKTTDEYTMVTRNGVKQKRKYASLDDITSVVNEPLLNNGLTYDWGDAILSADGCVTRNFILRHEAGHSRSTSSPPIPIEGGEAYKRIDPERKGTSASPQQRMGIADTYAMRYSMISGLGITSCDEDIDGHSGSQQNQGPAITEEQARSLQDMIVEYERNLAKFKNYFEIKEIAELPASKFDAACDLVKLGKLPAKK